MKRVAVIGAGPSGLAMVRACRNVSPLVEITVFDKQSDCGGLWLYDWRTGCGGLGGEPVHGSMYRYLWSNGPKECLEFADYSFLEHFGRPIPSYPPRAVLLDYIQGRLKKQNAFSAAKMHYNTAVRWVSQKKDDKFLLQSQNLFTGVLEDHEFDHCVVACGHYSTPHVPSFEGIETFPGRVLHAHDFRSAREFTGQRVLLVGSSYSAEDIGSQCMKYGAKSVSFSYRTKPMRFRWPQDVTTHPLLERVTGSKCTFRDGSIKEVDAIVLCTGYLNSYPFMERSLQLQTRNRLYPPDLYHGVVYIPSNRPKNHLLYLGMQDQYFTFNMFDAQAWLARDVILGSQKLPSREEMQKHSRAWLDREEKIDHYTQAIDFQRDYIESLLDLSDYPRFDCAAMANMFKEWEEHKVWG